MVRVIKANQGDIHSSYVYFYHLHHEEGGTLWHKGIFRNYRHFTDYLCEVVNMQRVITTSVFLSAEATFHSRLCTKEGVPLGPIHYFVPFRRNFATKLAPYVYTP